MKFLQDVGEDATSATVEKGNLKEMAPDDDELSRQWKWDEGN